MRPERRTSVKTKNRKEKKRGGGKSKSAEADTGSGRKPEAKRSRRAEKAHRSRKAGREQESRKCDNKSSEAENRRSGKAQVQKQKIRAGEKRTRSHELNSGDALQSETGRAGKTENRKSTAGPEGRTSGGAEKQRMGPRPKRYEKSPRTQAKKNATTTVLTLQKKCGGHRGAMLRASGVKPSVSR